MNAARADLTGSTILIVDDTQANVNLLERILERSGFVNVSSTTDSREALELVRSLRPDLLLLDLQMPHLDGFEVMSRLRETDETSYMPILVLTADATPESKRQALSSGAQDFLVNPFDPAEVMLRIKNLLHMRSLQSQLRDHNELLEVQVRERTAELWNSVRRLERAENDLRKSQAETVRRLSIAAEFRDDETARHIVRMSHYCELLAELADVDPMESRMILTASQMHDIGKIGTPDSILLKPGRLTPDERTIMERHTQDGWSILQGSESQLLQLAAIIALTHHERVDGSGYPNGLRGDDIPMVGRIAAIADVFDALSTDRVYRPAFPLPEVWRIMREGRGSHFDADLLDLFFDSMDSFLAILDSASDAVAT
ncbi:MAG: response regulator [Actinomycetota bacterium]|nr:response regulator [Actinomycetota bacterium]